MWAWGGGANPSVTVLRELNSEESPKIQYFS